MKLKHTFKNEHNGKIRTADVTRSCPDAAKLASQQEVLSLISAGLCMLLKLNTG